MARLNTEIVNLACVLFLSPGSGEEAEIIELPILPPRNPDHELIPEFG